MWRTVLQYMSWWKSVEGNTVVSRICIIFLLFVSLGSRGVARVSHRAGVPSNTSKQRMPDKLSTLGLFQALLVSRFPAAGVMPYDLNSALFSDYTGEDALELSFLQHTNIIPR